MHKQIMWKVGLLFDSVAFLKEMDVGHVQLIVTLCTYGNMSICKTIMS